jgi:hypothetical protein
MPQITQLAVEEVEAALLRYRAAVESTALRPSTKHTYIVHAEEFVRWLKDEFQPGAHVGAAA